MHHSLAQLPELLHIRNSDPSGISMTRPANMEQATTSSCCATITFASTLATTTSTATSCRTSNTGSPCNTSRHNSNLPNTYLFYFTHNGRMFPCYYISKYSAHPTHNRTNTGATVVQVHRKSTPAELQNSPSVPHASHVIPTTANNKKSTTHTTIASADNTTPRTLGHSNTMTVTSTGVDAQTLS